MKKTIKYTADQTGLLASTLAADAGVRYLYQN